MIFLAYLSSAIVTENVYFDETIAAISVGMVSLFLEDLIIASTGFPTIRWAVVANAIISDSSVSSEATKGSLYLFEDIFKLLVNFFFAY